MFSAAEQISLNLQSGSLDAQTASASVDMYVRFLKQMRTNGTCEKFYASCISEGVDKHGLTNTAVILHKNQYLVVAGFPKDTTREQLLISGMDLKSTSKFNIFKCLTLTVGR